MTYPSSWKAMQNAIHSWVSGVLPTWSVIWGRQQGPDATGEGPAPAKPFASLQALDLPDVVGRVDPETVDVSPTQMDVRMRGAGEFTLEIQLFANVDERASLETLYASLKTQGVQDALRTAGLAIIADGATRRDISDIFAGAREFRYVLEAPVRLEIQTTFVDQDFLDGSSTIDTSAIGAA